ncbi:MAG: DMT family transporter [Campylobacterales bacterium]
MRNHLWWAMLAAMLIWGGSWPVSKALTPLANPLVLAFWRFLISFVVFIPLLFWLKPRPLVPQPNPKTLLYLAIALTAQLLYSWLFFIGLQKGLASAGGILVTTLNPILTWLFVALMGGVHTGRREAVGLLTGFIGGGVLLEVWHLDSTLIFQRGNGYFLACAALWAIVTIATQRALNHLPLLLFSALLFGLSTLVLLPLVGIDALGPWLNDPRFWWGMIYLGVITNALATLIYFAATSRLGSARVSAWIFVVPASAGVLSWLFLDEQPSWNLLIGGALALLAVAMLSPKR